MTIYQKFGVVAMSVLLTVVILHFGLVWYVNKKLPEIINSNTSEFKVNYDHIDFSIWTGYILIEKISLTPKNAKADIGKQNGIFATVKSVEVVGFGLWSVLTSDRIVARGILIDEPKVVINKPNDEPLNNRKSINSKIIEPFGKFISVKNILIKKGQFKIINTLNAKTLASAANVDLAIDGVKFSDNSLDDPIPVRFRTYSFKCDSLFYKLNNTYQVSASKFDAAQNFLQIQNLRFVPTVTRREFIASLSTEKDLYTVIVPTLTMSKLDWGFNDKDLFVHAEALTLDKVNTNVYRAKMPADDLTKKKLYGEVLRGLKFDLDIKSINIKNSTIVYEEELTFEKGAGRISFGDFNMTASNVSNGFGKKSVPDVNIVVDCNFMKASPLKVNWHFNPLNKSEAFHIDGKILKFPIEELAVFTKPYVNATAKGFIDVVKFNFNGNDNVSKGKFDIEYTDLKVTVFQKNDRDKKNKVLTAIGNLFVKNDTNDKPKSVNVEVERIHEKSFYNLLWRSIAEGLKKTLI